MKWVPRFKPKMSDGPKGMSSTNLVEKMTWWDAAESSESTDAGGRIPTSSNKGQRQSAKINLPS